MKIQNICAFALVGSLVGLSALANPTEVVIRLKERVSMDELAKSVMDAHSPRYQQFYTPEEIRELAAPTEEEYLGIVNQLKQEGLELVSESPTRLFMTVRGERSILEKMDQGAKRPFSTLDFSPVSRGIASINGLVPSPKRHAHHVILHQEQGEEAAIRPMGTGKPKFTGTQPATIRQLYGFNSIYNSGITGKGQHIAIATYNDFYLDDVNQYYKMNNIKPGPQVDKVSFNGTATFDMGPASETETDAEFAGMIAPGASIHVFTSAQNNSTGELQLFTAILDDNRAKIVNYSWGSCETQLDPGHKADMESVFARAVAQGVNIFIASGDSGSDCQQDGSTVPDYPAANPNIVAVGGSFLANSNGDAGETAWNGSGGGISINYNQPDYQAQANIGGQYSMRSYPDVSFNADPNSGQPTWIHYDPKSDQVPAKASYVIIGGTSIASPQWAGFMALVNEARGGKSLGFLNPIFYAIPAASKNTYFHDIVSGSNGAYSAGPGWDAVTGWGSMRGAELFNYLKAL